MPFHFLLHGCGCVGFNSVNCFHAGCRGRARCFLFSFHPPPPLHIPPPPPGDVKCVLKKKKKTTGSREDVIVGCILGAAIRQAATRQREAPSPPALLTAFRRRPNKRSYLRASASLSLSLNTPGGPGGTLKRFHGRQIELWFSPKAARLRFSGSPVSRQHATSSRLSRTACEVEQK